MFVMIGSEPPPFLCKIAPVHNLHPIKLSIYNPWGIFFLEIN